MVSRGDVFLLRRHSVVGAEWLGRSRKISYRRPWVVVSTTAHNTHSGYVAVVPFQSRNSEEKRHGPWLSRILPMAETRPHRDVMFEESGQQDNGFIDCGFLWSVIDGRDSADEASPQPAPYAAVLADHIGAVSPLVLADIDARLQFAFSAAVTNSSAPNSFPADAVAPYVPGEVLQMTLNPAAGRGHSLYLEGVVISSPLIDSLRASRHYPDRAARLVTILPL
ncbi:MAG: type II toxin-antitoxin system PemK/MazF family toxin, partial [Myxococcota bacterium]